MPREMFTDVSRRTPRVGSQKWYTVPLSIMAHVIVVGALVVIPLMAADVLPTPQMRLAYIAAAPSPPPPPPPPAPPPRRAEPVPTPVPPTLTDAAPLVAPQEIVRETGLDLGFLEGVESRAPSSVAVGIVDRVPAAPPPPPPVPPRRVGGNIATPERVTFVPPVYPEIARRAHVDGIVVLEAVIDPTGRVSRVHVLRSEPLLDEAAVAAVQQWVYTPTLLNGVAVPVILTVTVRFQLE